VIRAGDSRRRPPPTEPERAEERRIDKPKDDGPAGFTLFVSKGPTAVLPRADAPVSRLA
jgi:hypothetical protein